jgi:hypothetical protein
MPPGTTNIQRLIVLLPPVDNMGLSHHASGKPGSTSKNILAHPWLKFSDYPSVDLRI